MKLKKRKKVKQKQAANSLHLSAVKPA